MDYAALFREKPSEAVACIEALKGLVVLGPWEIASHCCGRTSIPDGDIVTVEKWLDQKWHLSRWCFDDHDCALEAFDTSELAMKAADAALSELPNVILCQ